jgi:carbonic anhydrase
MHHENGDNYVIVESDHYDVLNKFLPEKHNLYRQNGSNMHPIRLTLFLVKWIEILNLIP